MIDAFGLQIPQNLGEGVRPDQCAVIVYDMQQGVVDQISTGKEIVAQCKRLLNVARERNYRVFYTRHMMLPVRASGLGQLHRSMVWQRQNDPSKLHSILRFGSPEWQIVRDLQPTDDEVVIDKITMSAFEGSFLNIAMRDARLSTFIIAGIALEVGIEPTIRHALDLNYLPVLVADACGSRTPELKDRSLATLAQTGEVQVAKLDDLLAQMRTAHE